MKARIFADIQCRDVLLSEGQKAKVESEVFDWLACQNQLSFETDEIQFWVKFKKAQSGRAFCCEVGVLGGSHVWEGAEQSSEPIRAFEHCLSQLNPVFIHAA